MEAGGSRQAGGRAPKSRSVRLAVPTVSLHSSGLPSLAGRIPAVSSGASSTMPKQVSSLHPSRGNSANGCAPLAASAVRQACSEEPTRRVFRRCCGHRHRSGSFGLFRPLSRATLRRLLQKRVGFGCLTRKNCAPQMSRTSVIIPTYPQAIESAVDKFRITLPTAFFRPCSAILFTARDSPIALGQQPQTQRVEFDETFGVLLVIGAGVVLEGDVALGIEAVG
jgi:hypothetical protein